MCKNYVAPIVPGYRACGGTLGACASVHPRRRRIVEHAAGGCTVIF